MTLEERRLEEQYDSLKRLYDASVEHNLVLRGKLTINHEQSDVLSLLHSIDEQIKHIQRMLNKVNALMLDMDS